MKKTTLLQMLNKLPQNFNLDDFLERLLIIEKIDEAMDEVKSGKTISHDKVKKMVGKWNK